MHLTVYLEFETDEEKKFVFLNIPYKPDGYIDSEVLSHTRLLKWKRLYYEKFIKKVRVEFT